MIYIFTAGILWGTIGLFVSELNTAGASLQLICFIRMSFAFLIMSAATLFKNGPNSLRIDMRTLIICMLLGLVSHGMFNVFYTSSIKFNGMGIASVLLYTAPVFTALASRMIFQEKLPPQKVFALMLNIAGCILTVTGGEISSGSLKLTGILAGIASGFCYGMAAILGRIAGNKTDALTLSAYSYLAAGIFLLVFMRPDIIPAMHNKRIMSLGFLYGLIPTAGAYMTYYIGLGKVSNISSVPIFASIEPVIAVIIGTQFYGEKLAFMNYAGIAVVLISIIIMVKSE